MLESLKINNVLFLDIETVSAEPSFEYLDEEFQMLWELKSKYFREKDGLSLEESYSRAGIYAEFGKIVCVSVGFITHLSGQRAYRTKSFYGEDEKQILSDFSELLTLHFNKFDSLLCAHNGKEFDFPYLCRRMLVNGLKIPTILNLAGKKPWEVQHLDTMQLWKFGDYKHYTSLKLLAKIFGIPSPKDDIDGSDVGRIYWEEKDLERIEKYCKKDVLTIAQLLLKYKGEALLDEDEIVGM